MSQSKAPDREIRKQHYMAISEDFLVLNYEERRSFSGACVGCFQDDDMRTAAGADLAAAAEVLTLSQR